MAEGGHEDRGFDLDPGEVGGEEIPMRPMRHDGTPFHREEEEETSFGGRLETEPLIPRERARDRAWEEIRSRFPRCDPKKAGFTAGIGDDRNVVVRLNRVNARTYGLFGTDGELNTKLPKAIRVGRGEPASRVMRGIEQRREGIRERIGRLREGAPTEENRRRIGELEAENERLEEENGAIAERMSLRERVKAIFEKHGLTAFAVLSAVGTIIGVIVSDLKSGLTKMSKGIGNGLKGIAKKLAGILPGIVGSLVGFLFKTAGEAIGFLSKHAWLLILLVVTFVVEQFKGGRRQG